MTRSDPQPAAPKKAALSKPWLAKTACAALKILGRLPLHLNRVLGSALGKTLAFVPNANRAISDLNLRLCFPEMPDEERRQLVISSLGETGKTVFELGPLWTWPIERLPSFEGEIFGLDVLKRALESKRGVLALTPHLGNWEVLNAFLTRHGTMHCLYRQPRILEVEETLCCARGRTGCHSIPASRGGVRQALRALRNGEILLILPDQEPLKANGVFAPFFGVPALTMTLVAQLLRRTGAKPVFLLTQRRADGRFDIHIQDPPEGLDDEDPALAAAALNRGLENCVRQCPEQYLWSYKRFKTAPPGVPTPYRAIWTRRQCRRAERRAREAAARLREDVTAPDP